MDKYVEDIIKELQLTELGRSILKDGREIALPFIKNMALAQYRLSLGDAVGANLVIDAMRRSLEDVASALSARLVNQLKEEIENFLKSLIHRLIFGK